MLAVARRSQAAEMHNPSKNPILAVPHPEHGDGGGGLSHLQNPCEQHILQLQLQCLSVSSYKDVLLR
jgi:hypothetical protein